MAATKELPSPDYLAPVVCYLGSMINSSRR